MKYVLWFSDTKIEDVPLVGGKNASLGEMFRNLSSKGVKVPDGFSVTAVAYNDFIAYSNLGSKIRSLLHGVDAKDVVKLAEAGRAIRAMILHAEMPKELRDEIVFAYHELSKRYKMKNADVAVRSSATAEDLPDASFAGQQETYLNVVGPDELLIACKKCFASLFTNRAISYRIDKKFDHFKVALSVGVQKMVRSDLACSGVMFTIDTESGFKDVILINSAYGLGESVVQGAVNPDQFIVFKPTLRLGKKPIVSKKLGEKKTKIVYSSEGSKQTKVVDVHASDREKFTLSDDEVIRLANWGLLIEEHYSSKRNSYTPMDIEWAKDGKTNELFIVQARPETVQSRRKKEQIEVYSLKGKGKVIVEGSAIGEKVSFGRSHVIKDVHKISEFKPGEVLVTDITDPDWEPIMKIASAIVTDRGGRTSHAAIVSRELGLPAVVGCSVATSKIKTGDFVTVSCAEGEIGKVYDGKIAFEVKKIDLASIPSTKTKIMMNVGNPDQAFSLSFLPNDGVGLCREEFIVTSYIKLHPLAALYPKKVSDEKVRAEIFAISKAYGSPKEFYVRKLAEGVATIAAAFYPKDVILRFSDFKSNEYANLLGGKDFEPKEDNPMIGWRGASRYYSEAYKDAFVLECEAVKIVRDEMGLVNLKVMVPFCRTVEEGKKVLEVMASNGLKIGKNGLEVYVMCEIPSNVILAEEFCKVFDGFSIGSNDLTQLTLGLDRDSELVAHIYDERNDAVKSLISQVISVAKKNKRKIGICGQAPSDYPDFAQFLVEQGIDSISLNPDTVVKTRLAIAKKEKDLEKK
ncbi:MAG: phosphoenolpyruvate synthase [Candidatus Diapherotrites archaeon]